MKTKNKKHGKKENKQKVEVLDSIIYRSATMELRHTCILWGDKTRICLFIYVCFLISKATYICMVNVSVSKGGEIKIKYYL